jgi:hypothetical protein
VAPDTLGEIHPLASLDHLGRGQGREITLLKPLRGSASFLGLG